MWSLHASTHAYVVHTMYAASVGSQANPKEQLGRIWIGIGPSVKIWKHMPRTNHIIVDVVFLCLDLILDNMMTIFGSGGHWVTNLSNLTIMISMMMMIIPDVCRQWWFPNSWQSKTIDHPVSALLPAVGEGCLCHHHRHHHRHHHHQHCHHSNSDTSVVSFQFLIPELIWPL